MHHKTIVCGVLSLAPCYVRKKQVSDKGVPLSYHHGKAVSSLVDDCQTMHPPPALFRKGEDGRKKKREVLHLFRCYTHTPGQSRVNPERQEEEKSGHTTGRRPKTAQGGRGTDGPPEQTYTAKRTWPKQRTHLNPTTHYGEARGEN